MPLEIRNATRRVCMDSSEHEGANISPPNCTGMLIFGKQAFFVMPFPNILSNPIISQIWFL